MYRLSFDKKNQYSVPFLSITTLPPRSCLAIDFIQGRVDALVQHRPISMQPTWPSHREPAEQPDVSLLRFAVARAGHHTLLASARNT